MGPKFVGQSGDGGCLEEVRAQVHRVPGEGSGTPGAPPPPIQQSHPFRLGQSSPHIFCDPAVPPITALWVGAQEVFTCRQAAWNAVAS